MVNTSKPARPVQEIGLWPPANSRPYRVLETDDWWKVADKAGIKDVWTLIEHNFKTRSSEEVNWYLDQLVGCRNATLNGKNYVFRGADSKKGVIYIPVSPPPSISPKKTYLDVIKELEDELLIANIDDEARLSCFLKNLKAGGDDRVIQWKWIAPSRDTSIFFPYFGGYRNKGDFGAVSEKWLKDNIKSIADVDSARAARKPGVKGMGGDGGFVNSVRKMLVGGPDNPQMTLGLLHILNQQITNTNVYLNQWSGSVGGQTPFNRGGMPPEYHAIWKWVSHQEGIYGTLHSCVKSAGRKPTPSKNKLHPARWWE